MKKEYLRLPAFIATFASIVWSSHAQQNLFPRGDFERGTTVDNLWDGINRTNQVNIPPRAKESPRQNAIVSSLSQPASAQLADVTNNGLPDLVVGSLKDSSGYFKTPESVASQSLPKAKFFPLSHTSARAGPPVLIITVPSMCPDYTSLTGPAPQHPTL